MENLKIGDLIGRAPWREAVTYRNTWLHEYGDYKYWLMTHWDAVDLDDGQNYVLNRAPLYRDRRDFVIQTGDTGVREDYPANAAK